MDIVAGILSLGLVSGESLRFEAASEQRGAESCGLSALASLLSLYCGTPAAEESLSARLDELRPARGERATLGDMLILLADRGLRARAYAMDADSLRRAFAAGYCPVVLRYDRPESHFVLLVGVGSEGSEPYVVADPSRGLEALSRLQLEGRWSGSALVVDRASVSSEGRALALRCAERALSRLHLLGDGGAAGAAERSLGRAGAR